MIRGSVRNFLTLYLRIGFNLDLERGRDHRMGLKSGALAERGGVNVQTIRYYEREGLLPPPPRLRSGYRMFPESAIQRVRFIKRAQQLGFALSEVRELLQIQIDPSRECSDVRRLAEAKIIDIEARIRTLQSMIAHRHSARPSAIA